MTTKRDKVRLYHFFNKKVREHGEPFGLCDECYENEQLPDFLVIEKISDDTDYLCNHSNHGCWEERKMMTGSWAKLNGNLVEIIILSKQPGLPLDSEAVKEESASLIKSFQDLREGELIKEDN